jgi:hypothetical protein
MICSLAWVDGTKSAVVSLKLSVIMRSHYLLHTALPPAFYPWHNHLTYNDEVPILLFALSLALVSSDSDDEVFALRPILCCLPYSACWEQWLMHTRIWIIRFHTFLRHAGWQPWRLHRYGKHCLLLLLLWQQHVNIA